jgi:hypothetical protein
MNHVSMDVLPWTFRKLHFYNPDTPTSDHGLVDYLRRMHPACILYDVDRSTNPVPEGREPAVFVGLEGLHGILFALPDRYTDEEDAYLARDLFIGKLPIIGSRESEIDWNIRHVLGTVSNGPAYIYTAHQ